MRIPSFPAVYIAFKAKGASLILACGHGWACLISLVCAVAIGIITIFMYEVPVHLTETGIWEVRGGGGTELYNTKIHLNYHYGMGFSEKYTPLPPADYYVEIAILKDSSASSQSFSTHGYSGVPIDCYYQDTIRSALKREFGTDDLYDSISNIFFVFEKANILSRYWLRLHGITNHVVLQNTYVQDGNNRISMLPTDKLDSLRGSSFVYLYSKTYTEENGIKFLKDCNYYGVNKRGNYALFPLMKLNLRDRPRWYSPYDISQAYFQYKIRFPHTLRHRSMLEIDYGGATEFSNIAPQPDSTSMSAIYYYDEEKLERIEKDGIWLHAKFRQLENLQILRMFVITTLWGFFVALTFSSGWKALRVRSRRFRLKQKKENKE